MKAEGRYVLAEGPVYDERTSTLYFADILEGKLHIKKDGDKIESISFGTYVTSVHLCDREDCVLATTRDEVYEVCISTGERRLVTSLSLPHTMRFNDGAVAPDGSLWMGTMKTDGPRSNEGSLYRIEGDGSFRTVSTGYGIANGLAFIDNETFIHTDSAYDVIRMYSYRNGNFECLKECTLKGECPDGLCLDAQGHILSALWNRGEIAVISINDFMETDRIKGFKTSLSSIALSNDGRAFITSAEDESGYGLLYTIRTAYRKKEDFLWKTRYLL